MGLNKGLPSKPQQLGNPTLAPRSIQKLIQIHPRTHYIVVGMKRERPNNPQISSHRVWSIPLQA